MASVEFSSVSKFYPGGACAVSELDLSIEEGEFLVLVGPSGCGKTTALRMVAGLEDISSGELRIGDRVVNALEPRKRDVAMVFQNYALYPHMSLFENIAFPLRSRRLPKAEVERRVHETARALGLSQMLRRRPGTLSGGQRQRVAMARAMVREPKVFLMDEPLSNLDAKLRVQMRAEVSRLQRDLGVTTIYVTHDQVEAMTMGMRIAVLRKGVLQQHAAPQTLYDRPANLFVATFIGSPAMNLIEAVIEEDGQDLVCVVGQQRMVLPHDVTTANPALRRYRDRRVAVGVRPEHLVDPSRRDAAQPRLRGEVVVVEALGSEQLVQMELPAKPVLTDAVLEIARDVDVALGDQLAADATAERVHAVSRFDPRTTVRPGETVEVSVDTDQLHFFDLDSGISLREDMEIRAVANA